MMGDDDDCGCFDVGGRLGMGPCPIHDHAEPTTRPALIVGTSHRDPIVVAQVYDTALLRTRGTGEWGVGTCDRAYNFNNAGVRWGMTEAEARKRFTDETGLTFCACGAPCGPGPACNGCAPQSTLPDPGRVSLTVDESTILRYLVRAAASPYARDPLKDTYELGNKEPANPYAALKSLASKFAALDAASALEMRTIKER